MKPPMADLPASLRLHPEPCQSVDDATVHRLLTDHPESYLSALETGLSEIASGAASVELPPKRIFDEDSEPGDFRVMPCVVRRGSKAVKTVKVVGTNLVGRDVPDQVTVGKALALDPEEHYVSHIFDACLLSSARTGACVTIASDRLAPRAETAEIVGCGRMAFYAALYLAQKGIREFRLRDVEPGRPELLARDLSPLLPGVCFEVGPSKSRADVLVLATTATVPFCEVADRGVQLTISVGADTQDQRELGESWSNATTIYVDTPDGIHVGDMLAWSQVGLMLPPLVDLLGLFRGTPAEPGPKLFISTGSALFDNLTIAYLLSKVHAPAGAR